MSNLNFTSGTTVANSAVVKLSTDTTFDIVVSGAATDVVIDVNGVGYEVTIPVSTFYDLGDVGAQASLRVHTHVREDAIMLFGFRTSREKELFLRLTSVSGIGPKLGITFLSGTSPDDLIAFVVAAQNEGQASAPAYFAGWQVSVSGGTIEDFAVERGGVRSGNTPSSMTIDFAALGAGKGQTNARAFAFLFVRPNPGSALVTLDTTTFVDETPTDTLTVVQPPPLRRVCVPIVE